MTVDSIGEPEVSFALVQLPNGIVGVAAILPFDVSGDPIVLKVGETQMSALRWEQPVGARRIRLAGEEAEQVIEALLDGEAAGERTFVLTVSGRDIVFGLAGLTELSDSFADRVGWR